MELVLVERRFDEPVSFEEIQKVENENAWCLETHHVRFIKTFVSRDRRRMVCLYEAPDAESVRKTQDQARIPYERAWTCMHLQTANPKSGTSSSETVIVERAFPEPVTLEFVENTLKSGTSCLGLYGATHLESYLARDGMKMVCIFHAPDAEAVRQANKQGQVPFSTAWTASLHEREQ